MNNLEQKYSFCHILNVFIQCNFIERYSPPAHTLWPIQAHTTPGHVTMAAMKLIKFLLIKWHRSPEPDNLSCAKLNFTTRYQLCEKWTPVRSWYINFYIINKLVLVWGWLMHVFFDRQCQSPKIWRVQDQYSTLVILSGRTVLFLLNQNIVIYLKHL